MTIDQTHPCPKCGQMSLVCDGMLAWRNGPRPPRSLAKREGSLATIGNQERERIYHCAQCGAEYFEDVETRAVHLWEEGTGKQYRFDPGKGGWYLRYFDKTTNRWIEQAIPKEAPSQSPQSTSSPTNPIPIELVPNQLSVSLYRHSIAYQTPIPCWTYITQGLWAFGQKELILTLRQDPNMAQRGQTPDFLLRLIKFVFDMAKAGKPVDAGGYTSLTLTDEKQKIGIPFHLLYLHPIPLAGIPLPERALCVRLMRLEELQVYQAYGSMRLMSSWAAHWHYYPCLPWSEMPAAELLSLAHFQNSILNKVSRLHFPQSTVCLEGEEVTWRLPPQTKAILAENLSKLAPEQPVAFLTGFDPGADASLAWLPEGNQITMNLPPGSRQKRVVGCFVLFIPAQQAATVKPFEDGFAVMLPTAAWMETRQALLDDQPLQITSPTWSFRLEHL